MVHPPPKGRGAGSNRAGRFDQFRRARDPEDEAEIGGEPFPEEAASTRTEFLRDHARSILARNESPDIPFAVSVNPYRGCEHGCAYCYARPTHEYLGYSAGLDFETKIFVKEDAPLLLRRELLSPKYQPEVINISGVTDCYQPAERRYRLTRACLEVLAEFRNPCTIVTKNQLVTRDVDLLAEMAKEDRVAVFVTVTSLDPNLCGILEPRTSRPAARLGAIRTLHEAGIPVGVMVAPVIPAVTDHEMPRILEAAAQAGARHAGFVPLRLPLGVAPLFVEWLETYFPDRKEKVLNRIKGLREGKLNDPNFSTRMQGSGDFADLLGTMFRTSARKYGLNENELKLSTAHFQRPGEQLTLFS
jgi:DNA repair photolyase